MILYHATLENNLASIMKDGLIPQVGPRSQILNEPPAVFLFPTYGDCETALGNWLGEEFDEIIPYQKAITLKVDLPDDFPLVVTAEYERMSMQAIPPQFIEFYKEEG